MAKYYYIDRDKQQQGPYTVEELGTMNVITSSTPVWCEGMSDWTQASAVPAFAYLFTQPQTPPVMPSYAPGAAPQAPRRVKPDSWLVLSILSVIFCCQPFSIVAIIYAARVDSLWASGYYDEAEAAAKNAKTWTIVSAIVAVVFWIIYGILVAIGVASSFANY